MPSLRNTLLSFSLAAVARGHSVILGAQGLGSSPASVGFQVDPDIARNCITINPCQQDATIIRDAEITANIVNQCGRTELSGNIDVGENTENALAAGKVTQVEAGGEIQVTIHQVNADGAGPYVCDLDESSNTNTNIQNLTVTNNVPGANGFSQVKTQAFNITVKMPDDLNCFGASTGNVCTVRCRNTALAGPFGGCFAVQQAGAEEKTNTPQSITTAQTPQGIADQILQNNKDFPDAVKANEDATSDEAEQNRKAVEALLGETVVSQPAPTQTLDVELGRPDNADNGNNDNNNNNGDAGNGNGNGDGNNNGNGNGGNGGNNNDNGNGQDQGQGQNNGNGNGQDQGQGQGNGNGNGNGNGQGNNGNNDNNQGGRGGFGGGNNGNNQRRSFSGRRVAQRS